MVSIYMYSNLWGDHLPYKTIFWWLMGWSYKAGSTVVAIESEFRWHYDKVCFLGYNHDNIIIIMKRYMYVSLQVTCNILQTLVSLHFVTYFTKYNIMTSVHSWQDVKGRNYKDVSITSVCPRYSWYCQYCQYLIYLSQRTSNFAFI